MQILPPTSKVVLLFLPTSHVVFTMLYVCKSSVLSTVVKSITKLLSMPFDLIKFNGGLKTVGIPSKMVCNIQHYGIKHYQDLDPFLGSFWHYRGLNVNGDYGYVQLDTVSFLCKRNCCEVLSKQSWLKAILDASPMYWATVYAI